ncbi:MAG: hypothetical protein LBR73_06595 [Oscillospiraceae bacterium]|jgi:hypothetical protein|nr:hypothetical protein [Oscillospiraceae bacterium]
MKRTLVLLLLVGLTLSLISCGNTPEETSDLTAATDEVYTSAVETTPSETTLYPLPNENTLAAAESTSASISTTSVPTAAETTASTAKPTAPYELASTDIASVLALYKRVAAANAAIATSKSSVLQGEIYGENGETSAISKAATPIFKSIVGGYAEELTVFPGSPQALKASDIKSASAETKDGNTVITLKLKDQTDGINGKTNEGSVGRGIAVLDGIAEPLANMKNLGIDIQNAGDTIKLKYTNAVIKVTVNAETGKVISGSWGYDMGMRCAGLLVKVLFFEASEFPQVNADVRVEFNTK